MTKCVCVLCVCVCACACVCACIRVCLNEGKIERELAIGETKWQQFISHS
jgi:hypothetical protein